MAVTKKGSNPVKKTGKIAKKQTEHIEQEGVFISDADMYIFGQGTHYDIYKKLGAHPCVKDGVSGTFFGVWAPHAQSVSVVGSFNNWEENAHPMEKLGEIGIYAAFVPEAKCGDMYKFLIKTKDGRTLYKADPYANYAELRPGTASVITDITKMKWSDNAWMEERKQKDLFE